ncbi:MAG: hypothetical protein SFY80_01890 [Verrucomicrobiota bacterium]|nr:hypothetical protein [Verrucomicrobiota bacterium]
MRSKTLPWIMLLTALLLWKLIPYLQRAPLPKVETTYNQAAYTPKQTKLEPTDRPFTMGKYTVTPLARYQFVGVILSAESYSDDGSDISPIDWAMAWGRCAKPAVWKKIDITQQARFYLWSVEEEDLDVVPPLEIITASSANIHLIPAANVVPIIKRGHRGVVAELSGMLVKVTSADGFIWASSLSRTDSGAGACELFYVETVKYLE